MNKLPEFTMGVLIVVTLAFILFGPRGVIHKFGARQLQNYASTQDCGRFLFGSWCEGDGVPVGGGFVVVTDARTGIEYLFMKVGRGAGMARLEATDPLKQ